MSAIKDWYAKRPQGDEKQTNFSPVTGSLRKLTVCAASTLLECFDQTMGRMDKSSLVGDMTSLRSRGFNANHFIDMVLRKGDTSPPTGIDKLKFLAFGSPALRFILYQLHIYVLPPSASEKPRKLLLTEDIPLSAQFWKLCVNFVYVECAVLHAGLSDPERVQLVARFNDPDDNLLVLIIVDSDSSQGVNLDRCCHRVIVVTRAGYCWGASLRGTRRKWTSGEPTVPQPFTAS